MLASVGQSGLVKAGVGALQGLLSGAVAGLEGWSAAAEA